MRTYRQDLIAFASVSSKISVCPLAHFFCLSIYYFNFFIPLNIEKKWVSGQEASKPLRINGLRLPTFEIKVGFCPLFLGFFAF